MYVVYGVANCNYKYDLWWAVNYLYTQDFPLPCDVWKEIHGRANKGGGVREGKERASERAQKNTIHCGNVFNIHLHAAHTHSQQIEYPKKGPLDICTYMWYIYSVYYIYPHMTNIGSLVECQSPHTNSSIKLSRDQSWICHLSGRTSLARITLWARGGGASP